ncbi:putative ribonuclease H-like domain-containing protein [Tanacetum coccineum]
MAGSEDDIPPPPPPSQTPTQQTPHIVSTIKLPILKKGEYDIWAMKMEHYLAHTDYPIWEVIQRGNGPVSVSTDTNGLIKVLPPKTAKEILARERERKARTTLLMALPEDHLAKFHKMTYAKEMWEAIKSRFGGNDESKKMQKYILKQQFEGFSVSNSEGLHKGFDRFQSLMSQLEIHGEASQLKMQIRNSLGLYLLSGLKVFESDVKGSTASSSSTQNVAFVLENTSSTNDVRNFARECRSKGNQDSRMRDAWNTRNKDKENGRRSGSDIEAYTQALKKVEAQLVAHQQSQLWYEEKISQTSDRDKAGLGQETHESMLELVVNEPKVVSQSKVWYDTPIIEEYESDSEDEHTVPTNAARKVNTVKPIVNNARPKTVNTTEVNAVSVVGGKRETAVNTSAGLSTKSFTETKGIIDSGCSRHMTGNKAYLTEYQDFNGGPVAFRGSKGYITGKGTVDESNKLHRRLGHVNFKNLNKLVKGNLVRGLPSKIFQNDHTCVACQKGKQHKASCKAKVVSSISQPLQLLHMDLFGPTSIRSINHKTYCLVITDDFSRFSWVFFLRTKDETSGIFKDFIRQIENQLNQKVKTIRCDNGIEFKNRDIIEFCGSKWIKREYSNAKTPQQNGVAERKNRTLIEAARTMLADSFLPNTFWAEAVSTACYVLNRVLVTKPQNKTPYELITGKIPIISYIRPFGCHVTILNTIDHLGKFEGKSDEGFLVGYSLNSKAFRVYNLETKRVEENLHINFLENKPNVAGKGPNWLFDLDYLTDSMNYQPVRSENQANKTAGPEEANHSAGTQDNIDAGNFEMEAESASGLLYLQYGLLILQQSRAHKQRMQGLLKLVVLMTYSTYVNTASKTCLVLASPYGGLSFTDLTNTDQDDSEIPALEDIYDNPTAGIFINASYDDEGVVADFTNLETIVNVSPIPTSRINSIRLSTLILGDPNSAVQTRSKVTKSSGAHAFVSYIQKQRRNNHKDFQHCLFACFLSQNEPKKISEALEDES